MAQEGQKTQLEQIISDLPDCEVFPSENKDVLVVITETPNNKQDKKLFQQLNGLPELQMLTLVSAFSNNFDTTN
mgnify:CR=1 FL=1